MDASIYLARKVWHVAEQADDVKTMLIMGQMLDKLQLTARILDAVLANPERLDDLITLLK